MALALFHIYKNKGYEFFHLEDFFHSIDGIPSTLRGDAPKLRHWKLIEKKEGKKDDGNPSNGYYRITGLGRDFVEGRAMVASHIFMFNNKLQGHSDTTTNFKKSLDSKFNYDELMK
jgi:hypothetical protein